MVVHWNIGVYIDFKLGRYPVDGFNKMLAVIDIGFSGLPALCKILREIKVCIFLFMSDSTYIHGTHAEEQDRLAKLNEMTNYSFITFLEIKDGDRVLEVGSGLGLLAKAVARANPSSKVTGLELSDDQLNRAMSLCRDTPNLEFIQGNALKLQFPDKYFDVVYCRYLLEHVTDPLEVMREALRVLAVGGSVFVQENNTLAITFHPSCPAFIRVWRRFADYQRHLGGDALIGKRLFSLLKESGFEDIKLSIDPEVHYFGIDSFHPWIENLIIILEGAAEKLATSGFVTSEELDAAVSELRRFQNNPIASSYFYWNRACGRKLLEVNCNKTWGQACVFAGCGPS